METDRRQESRTQEEKPSLSSVAKELSESLKAVIRSEMKIAKAELKQSSQSVLQHSKRMAIFGAIAAFGIFPVMALLVIGLGRILGDNYWLSSLIVAIAMFAIGGGVAYASFKRLKTTEFRFDDTRDSVVSQIRTVDRGFHDVTDTARKRTAA